MPRHTAALKFLAPGWFAIVMGLCGLSLAWQRAIPLMGEGAAIAAQVLAVVAAAVFTLLALASLLRAQRHAAAWREDLAHPVRHVFVAALPISLLLLATVAVALTGPGAAADALWRVGSVAQYGVTLWVLARWWRGMAWASATPALFIPVVGNVLAPLAGVPLGHEAWAAAQFGVGLLFWPVVLVLVLTRLAVQGAWPERLAPTTFIFAAPPAVVGLAALQFGAPAMLVWMLWGMALFCAAWAALLAPRIARLPFAVPHWGMSFPLAALAALTLRLAAPGTALAGLALALLALATLVITALTLATLRGLRDGSLLAPEPVAAVVAAA
jgi:tellurite resistance protein